MHNSCGVRCFEALTYLTNESCGLGRRQLAFLGNQTLKVHTFDEVHGDELRRTVFTNVKDANYILVGDGLSEEHFLLETLQRRRCCRHFRENGLQSNNAGELTVEGFVHCSHATDTQQVDNLVASRKDSTELKRRCFFRRDKGGSSVKPSNSAVG